MIEMNVWKAFLDYGRLVESWINDLPVQNGGAESPAVDVASLCSLTERYGTGTALAWLLQRNPATEEVRSHAGLVLLYGRTKVERQLQALEMLARAMNVAGITPLLLKGSAAQVGGMYPDPGFRQMADIDLLVPPEDFETCIEVSEQVGFTVEPWTKGRVEHALLLRSRELGMLLEIHHRLRMQERDEFLAPMLLKASHPADFRGSRVLLPDWSHHAAVTILHAVAWDRSRYMALVPIRALLDLAALKVSGLPVCWNEVQEQLDRAGERTSLVHVETLFRALFSTPLSGIEVSEARQRRILLYYSIGVAYPRLHNLGLVVNLFRNRLVAARRDPVRLLQLLTPGFYWRLAGACRKALGPLN